MVDTLGTEQVERFGDVGRRTFLAGVSNHRLAEFAAAGKQADKLRRRMAFFG